MGLAPAEPKNPNVLPLFCTNLLNTKSPYFLLKVALSKILCSNCNVEVVQYYDDAYKGRRAKCPICGVSFPLE